MQSLYRKYRPTKLSDVVGQPSVTTAIQNALDQDKVGHAYLFIGPRGTGKTSVARIFAHAINHFDYQLEDSYLDIIEIDAASNNGVDNIRDLREKAIIAPSTGQYKIYIIDEVHMLSKSAANALLKTLEEPPAHTVFIMATTEADKIPITITSRTQLYTFKLASPEVMVDHLTKIAASEKINIEPSALQIVARRSGGSFRDALSLLDQVASLASTSKAPIDAAFLEHALGLPSAEAVQGLLAAYSAGDLTALQAKLQDLLSLGLSPENIARELIAQILHHPQPTLLSLLSTLPDVRPPFAEARLLVALCANVPKSTTIISAPENHTRKIAEHANKAADLTSTIPSKITEEKAPSENLTSETEHHIHKPKNRPPKSNHNFDWADFLATVREKSAGAADQLQKCKYELQANTLHLYPSNKFTAKALSSSTHSAALSAALGDLALEIHDQPKPVATSPELAKISEIMGSVEEVSPGDLPF